MTKKNRKDKDKQPTENELAEDQVELTGSASGENEADSSSAETQADASMDDLLDDVRRSLIEEDTVSQDSKGWLGKFSKGRRKGKKPAEPVEEKPAAVEPMQAKPEPESEYLEQIDELIDMLEPVEAEPVSEPKIEVPREVPEEPVVMPEPEPEPEPVDLDELKKRVFSPSKEEKPEEDFSQVRAVALEGGEEVFIEVESKRVDERQDRLKALENSLMPYRGMLFFLLAFLAIVLAVAAGTVMYRTYQSTLPPTPTPVESDLPFPTQVILPGGLSFNLGKGQIVEGEWNPQGPEWLRGTEVCRWVAIPWSRPLEAAVRTLTRQDSIELVMSNSDRLTYNVFSIESLTLEEMQALDQNSPCLLVVLAEQDAEQRWVVTAKP